jgi:uncharacterized protein
LYKRPVFREIIRRIQERRRFAIVLAGPRQTGKTTLARQVMKEVDCPCHYGSADEPAVKGALWIEQQWEVIRSRVRQGEPAPKGLLVLDEIQKIPAWSETVKRLWDEDSASGLPIHLLLLGSSPLLVQQGLTESLAGRFEILPVTHWSFVEMREAFGWDLDRYLFFGGYPGAVPLIGEWRRWSSYILESLIETSVSRDILQMTRVDKPALLHRLFHLGCSYSGQILSYQKMLGQLQDAGNTTTLAHYLRLLGGAGLIMGLEKYAGRRVRQRASSPKLLVLNTALMTACSRLNPDEARQDFTFWGRVVESAVGASLANGIRGKGLDLFYWSDRNREVDFVLARGKKLTAIEVKSMRRRTRLPGLEAFSRQSKVGRSLLVGSTGIPLEEFLAAPAEQWVE